MLALAACHPAAPPRPPEQTPEQTPAQRVPPPDNLGPIPTPQRSIRDDERACVEDSDLWGCTIAGMYYRSGDEAEHIPVDGAKAVRYLERGCRMVPEACAMLIVMYETGDGVTQDLAHADRLVDQMCADGHEDYCDRTRAPAFQLE